MPFIGTEFRSVARSPCPKAETDSSFSVLLQNEASE